MEGICSRPARGGLLEVEEKPAQVAMAPKAIGKAGDLPVAKCSRTKGNCQMRSQNTSQRESRRERMSEERRPGAGSFSPEPLGESAFNRLPLGEKRGVRGCWLCLEGGGRLHRPEASAQRDRRWEGSALSQGRQGFLGISWRRVVENLEDESERMRSGGSEP